MLSERTFKAVGKALPRNEDRRLVTGRGQFSDDFTLPGQVWAAMVRSPHPHARIAAIDTAEAMAMPGVLGVYTGADVQTDGLRPIPHNPVPSTDYDVKLTGRGGTEVFIGLTICCLTTRRVMSVRPWRWWSRKRASKRKPPLRTW